MWHSFSPPAPVLRVGDEHSFAQHTFRVRLPAILRKVWARAVWTPEQRAGLQALGDELTSAPVRPLRDREAPDVADWDSYLEPWRGQRWAELPFYFAEAYFYRRLLEATGFFPDRRDDPFSDAKREELDAA